MPEARSASPPPVPPPLRSVPYGPDPAQLYDVRMPARGRAAATVVVVHGGFWRERHDRTNAEPMAQAFADDGFAVAVLEYRRVDMPGGGWPGTADDVRAAVLAVAADDDLPSPIIAVGHSAGGHLVALLASSASPESSVLAGVVSLGGCVDLTLTARLNLGDGAAQAFMRGGPGELPQQYADADPALLAPPAVPVHLVHGTADDVVPVEVSRSYVRAAAAGGTEVPLTGIPDGDHFGLVTPGDPAFAVVLEVVRAMSARALGAP